MRKLGKDEKNLISSAAGAASGAGVQISAASAAASNAAFVTELNASLAKIGAVSLATPAAPIVVLQLQ
jgi:hypothetical protein